MYSDPVADMLTRIRNALTVHQSMVLVPSSKLKVAIARIMAEEGFIEKYEVTKDQPQPLLKLWMKYGVDKKPVLSGLRRVSKPGRRVYASFPELPRVLAGIGLAVISTPRGVMSDKQARRQRLGGEVICHLW